MNTHWYKAADAVPVWFIVEDSFWGFCDNRGREWWNKTHSGTPVKRVVWNRACLDLWRRNIHTTTEDKSSFWKSSLNAFNRFKAKMDASFAFLVSRDGSEFLLVQAVNSSIFSLPGGKCHVKEGEDVRACLSRELKEELNFTQDVDYVLHDYHFLQDKRPFHLFLAQQITSKPPQIDKKEIMRFKWSALSSDRSMLATGVSKISCVAHGLWESFRNNK